MKDLQWISSPMGKNWHRPSTLWSTNLWQSRNEHPMEKGQYLQQMVLGKLVSYMWKNETGILYYTIHKNQLKMDERLKCRTQICKIPRRKHRGKLLDTGLDSDTLDVTWKAQETKARIDKWNCIELESFYMAKETINRGKRKPTEWNKIFANHISDYLIRG